MTDQREPGQEPETESGQNGLRWAPENTDAAGQEPRYVTGEPSRAVEEPTGDTGDAPTPAPADPEPTPGSQDVTHQAAPTQPSPAAPEPEPVSQTVPEDERVAPTQPIPATPEPAAPEPTPVAPAPEPTGVASDPAPETTAVPAGYVDSDETAEVTRVASPVPPVPAAPAGEPDQESTSPTVALPATVAAQAIFRDSPAQDETIAEPLSDEAQKLAAERAARKEAREAALAAAAPVAVATPEPVVIHERTNDKFLGSLGLFLLRLVVAAIFTVRGIYTLTHLVETQEQFAQTIIPYPQIMAIATGVAMLLIALALVLGLLTRIAGVGVLLIAGGALAFVLWGPWNIFLDPVAGQRGAFLGEFELLLATVGVLFLLIGGGGWSLDRSFRSARAKDKAERQSAR